MIRVVRVYLAVQHAITQKWTPPLRFPNLFQHGALQPCHRVKDVRVRRLARLSMVYAILVMQTESSQILAAIIVAVPAALVIGTLYTTGVLD